MASALQALQARAEARALLFSAGEYPDADSAIAPLLDAAWRDKLIDRLGVEGVMAIIDKAFAPYWDADGAPG